MYRSSKFTKSADSEIDNNNESYSEDPLLSLQENVVTDSGRDSPSVNEDWFNFENDEENQMSQSSIPSSSEKKINQDPADSTLGTPKIFYDSTEKQFVRVEELDAKSKKRLNFSAKLFYERVSLELHSGGCLMVLDNDIVVEVTVLQSHLLSEAESFENARDIILRELRVVRVLSHSNQEQLKQDKKALLSGLENVLKHSSVEKESVTELSEIAEKLKRSGMLSNTCVCRELIGARFLNEQLKKQAAIVDKTEQSYKGKHILQKFGLQEEDDLYPSLRQLLAEHAKRHTDSLIDMAPEHLRKLLRSASEKKLSLVTKDDLKLFADMESDLNADIFSEPLKNLQQRWIQYIKSTDRLTLPTTNKIFFYLCKSLGEIIVEISEKTGISERDLLQCNSSGWKKKDQIIWEKEDVSTKCLERQYNFLFRLLEYYDFGKGCRQEPFKYISNPPPILEELRVWYYLLHDTFKEILKNCTHPTIKSAFQRYTKLLLGKNKDQLETVRLATHKTIQHIVHEVSNMSSVSGVSNKNSDGTLKSEGKFFDSTGEQYIEVRIPTSKILKNLNFSAQLIYEDMKVVLYNEGCLMTVDDDLMTFVEIQQPNELEEAKSFEDAKSILFRNIRIVKILSNESLANLKQNRKPLLSGLENVLKQSTIDNDGRLASVELSEIVEKLHSSGIASNGNICKAIEKSQYLNEDLKGLAAIIDEEEKRCSKREQAFAKLGLKPENDSQYLYQGLRKLLTENSKRQASFLMESVPDDLRESLSAVSQEKLIYITKNDIKLFADMASVLSNEIFAVPLKSLQQRWIKKINSTEISHMNSIYPTTNIIYFFLCKSLEELVIEISDKTSIKRSALVECDASGWKKMDQISWEKEDLSAKCLQRQYNFIFRLLDHFDLGKNCNRKLFKYTSKVFNNSKENSSALDELENLVSNEPKDDALALLKLLDVPEERCVWYYMLDDAVFCILTKDTDRNHIENILQSYLKLVRETKLDQLETLRVATHNTIQFILQIVPYMSSGSDVSPVDQRILQTQCDKFSSQLSNTTNFRDLVNVFGSYWRVRTEVITDLISRMPHPKMHLLRDEILRLVLLALEKSVETESLLAFFRTFEEFLTDISEVPFDWFIKTIPNIDMQMFIRRKKVEVVDNKIKDMPARTYRVIDPKEFTEFCQTQTNNVEEPKHYVIEVLQKLLSHVASQLQRKSWTSGGELSSADQLSTSCELISTIHHSLLYLKEQANYVEFDTFYAESVDPFTSLIENSESRKDFSTRVHLLKESFWFIRKQNEVSLETVLRLYKKLNPNLNAEALKQPYEEYLEHFKKYMQLTVGKDCTTAATLIAKNVNELVSKDKHFTTWDSNFKKHKLPQILAGLGAVWSVLVSKDVSSAGRYLSPNCVQILCVLRLFSVDKQPQGIDKHLAQVLTGQGKSLILALVAALLALTGHNINIGCYSKYLVDRDQENFQDFYSTLNVTDVTYGSLCSLMEKFINPEVDGKTMGLRTLVKDLLLNDKTTHSNKLVASTHKNSILLVDEVDVFFSKKFYGNTYNPVSAPTISGLDKIQEFIWEMVTKRNSNVGNIKNKIQQLIQSATFLPFSNFHTFRSSNKSYKILTPDGILKSYTNKTLLDDHLEEMIESAIEVFKSSVSTWSDFKLNSLEQITLKNNEEYVTGFYWGYLNIFNYFRLKKHNFLTEVNGEKNYGYLLVNCGSLSYAKLPMDYPLILGVSGTLTDLNDYEKKTIDELYGIKQLSAMPTFYGSSNLRFDKTKDFHYFSTKSTWRSYIFSQTNKIVVANRAVLIFFDNDLELNAFKSEYGGQFDRLNELTENTDNKEKCINEAGIAKTITLATRGMGRGVDYKTSLLVEKNEGVHVIQTFFSMDVKEETQIKGRTARQDNKGSYELAVCRDDLMRCKLISNDSDVSYSNLATKRTILSSETNKSISHDIEKNKAKHNATMSYMKSFF